MIWVLLSNPFTWILNSNGIWNNTNGLLKLTIITFLMPLLELELPVLNKILLMPPDHLKMFLAHKKLNLKLNLPLTELLSLKLKKTWLLLLLKEVLIVEIMLKTFKIIPMLLLLLENVSL